MNLNLVEIGRFIQSCRKDKGLTQAELSERLNVSPQAVSNWERGETLPDVATLPDLAVILGCSVDAILYGGAGGGSYRRHITVEQMRSALGSIDKIGEDLGRDHFIYRCMMEALNQRMNTTLEKAFSDDHIFEIFTMEFLLECVKNGDYVDPRDVQNNLKDCKAKAYLLNFMKENGIK